MLAEKPCFSVVRVDMVQILNTHPQSGGMHWLTISTVGCPKDTVNIYDSAGDFIGYNINVMRQTACLVVNPIKVNSFAYLFNCTTVGRTSD